jgi:excinuclease ABC subunit C
VELAERCGLSQKAAKAVRAAAKLALEDQAAAKERLAAGGSRSRRGRYSAASLAADALAEEAAAEPTVSAVVKPSVSAAAETDEDYPAAAMSGSIKPQIDPAH